MKTNKEIRLLARQSLSGNWMKMLLVNIMVYAILFSGFYISDLNDEAIYLTVAVAIISVVLVTGQTNLTFNIAKGKKWRTDNFFVGIKEYLRSFGYNILTGLMVVVVDIIFVFLIISNSVAGLIGRTRFLGFKESIGDMHIENMVTTVALIILLLFILVLIKIVYSMTIYIILEKNKGIGLISSMKYSRKLMKGRKFKLVGLYISFVGWMILSILTLGIGLLYLNSYIMTSLGIFYLDLLKDKEDFANEKGLVSHQDFVEDEVASVFDGESIEVELNEDTQDNKEYKETHKDDEKSSEASEEDK